MEYTKRVLHPFEVPDHHQSLSITWARFKAFLEELSPEQLELKAHMWAENFGMSILRMGVKGEDYHIYPQLIGSNVVDGRPVCTYGEILKMINEANWSNIELTFAVRLECEKVEGLQKRRYFSLYSVEEITEDLINISGDTLEPLRSYTEKGLYQGDPKDFERDKADALEEPIIFRPGQLILDSGE